MVDYLRENLSGFDYFLDFDEWVLWILYYDRIDSDEGIDLTKSKKRKEYIVCHYWYFNHRCKFVVCNSYHDLTMLCLNPSNSAIITVNGVDYRCIVHHINKPDAIHSLKNSALDDCVYKMHVK